ncbi:hypothetical protein AWH63_10870 [Marinobacter sp. C18]|uniref:hypothetical protein n=1 Tax=Marinobacter sp. C18 TaxID=1772288 RepID=UPI000948A4DA|nr:hypothetical protein [Marinobacter sp. C18]OLF82033.1 hypothetical protein AWH63_10870 [Marinobacter sp. C18]
MPMNDQTGPSIGGSVATGEGIIQMGRTGERVVGSSVKDARKNATAFNTLGTLIQFFATFAIMGGIAVYIFNTGSEPGTDYSGWIVLLAAILLFVTAFSPIILLVLYCDFATSHFLTRIYAPLSDQWRQMLKVHHGGGAGAKLMAGLMHLVILPFLVIATVLRWIGVRKSKLRYSDRATASKKPPYTRARFNERLMDEVHRIAQVKGLVAADRAWFYAWVNTDVPQRIGSQITYSDWTGSIREQVATQKKALYGVEPPKAP